MSESKLDIAKRIIKDNYKSATCGLFDCRGTGADKMYTLYSEDGLEVDICYYWEYFEVFGLSKEDFAKLESYYDSLGESEEKPQEPVKEKPVTTGGCGQCPYDETSCYEMKKTGGICAYDGVFTQITFAKCPYRLAPTNADRLRNMTDERLAQFLYETEVAPDDKTKGHPDIWLEWLKEEVKE